jgi:hypothetical protein
MVTLRISPRCRLRHFQVVDVLALAAVIIAGVGAASTGINACYSTRRTAKTAQETRINQRQAESYLEVLRLIEVEAQWADAWSTNRKIEAEGAD